MAHAGMERRYTLTLTQEEATQVREALGDMVGKLSAALDGLDDSERQGTRRYRDTLHVVHKELTAALALR